MKNITVNSDFKNIKEDIEILQKDLDSIKTKYVSIIEEIDASARSLDFNSWHDDIQKELSNYLNNNFRSDCNKVSKDLESGNFVSLYNSVTNLVTELGFCIECKERIDAKKEQISNTAEKVEETPTLEYWDYAKLSETGGQYEPQYVDNPVYTQLCNELSSLNTELSGYVTNCNIYLNIISSITFIGSFDKVDINESSINNYLPDCVYNTIPDNLSDDYHPDITIDYNHGVDSAHNIISKSMKLFRNYSIAEEGLHFMYNENDHCYYEVNQNLTDSTCIKAYDDIPYGESPFEHGYIPFSIDDLKKMSIISRR